MDAELGGDGEEECINEGGYAVFTGMGARIGVIGGGCC